MSVLLDQALAMLAAGETRTTARIFYNRSIKELDLTGCPKRVEIRCGIGDVGSTPCRKKMGEVLQTRLGGLFVYKVREDDGRLDEGETERRRVHIEDEYAKWLSEERGAFGGPNGLDAQTPEEYYRLMLNRTIISEHRHLIADFGTWGDEAVEPGGGKVACALHGFHPAEKLPLELEYREACRTSKTRTITCHEAELPDYSGPGIDFKW